MCNYHFPMSQKSCLNCVLCVVGERREQTQLQSEREQTRTGRKKKTDRYMHRQKERKTDTNTYRQRETDTKHTREKQKDIQTYTQADILRERNIKTDRHKHIQAKRHPPTVRKKEIRTHTKPIFGTQKMMTVRCGFKLAFTLWKQVSFTNKKIRTHR